MSRLKIVLFIPSVMTLAVASAAGADEIILRPSVRLAPDASIVRLGDVAELRGAEAGRHADLVIASLPDPGRATEISVEQIRDLLTQAGAHWGRTNLTGGRVIVRPRRASGAEAPRAMIPATLPGASEQPSLREPRSAKQDQPSRTELAADIIDEATLRGAVTGLVIDRLRVPAADVKLIFAPADEAVLRTSPADFRFEFETLSSVDGDRIELAVRFWAAGLVHARHQLTVRALMRATVAVAGRDIDRGQVIASTDLSEQAQWLAPRQAAAASGASSLVGMIAAKRLRAGEPIEPLDVRAAIIIHRGDRAVVRCLVGGIAIAVQAEATQDGARGDAITFRKIGERSEFAATVSGPGEAVVDLRH